MYFQEGGHEQSHDRFFKETMTRWENAVSFFRENLPAEIVSQADWRTLRIVKETFITQELRECFSDIVYEIRVRGTAVLIYLLFEHQSRHDCLMPLRFHHYMGGLWDLWLRQNPGECRLPAVIPVLFYHGSEKWTTGTQFQDMIAGSDLFAEYVPRFRYILRDLSVFTDADMKGIITVRVFVHVMRRIFQPDFGAHFDGMLPLFAELSRKQTGMEYLETILRYVYDVRDDMDPEETETKLIQVMDESRKEDIMTVAEKLRKEGEIRGEIRGEIKTYRQLLASGLLSKEMAEQKLAELERILKELGGQDRKETEH
ncbi:MAG: Rpn family recombination-promoting nuclease/putative transposase [Desulfobacterales bacterium]